MTQDVVDVAIVGAGPAGLSTAGALSTRGLTPLVLDEGTQVGERWARRYERLHLHTVRRFSGLAHYRIPRRYPRYLSKDDFAGYLREYARRFSIDVRTQHRVTAVRAHDGCWAIESERGDIRARSVVIATGHYNRPVLPDWEGQEDFAGRLLHSSEYRSGVELADQRVLVVGLGNTGAEIAADLVEQGAASTSIAVRTPPPIVPREMLGLIPIQLFGLALSPIRAPRLLDRVSAVLRRVVVGDLRKYGIAEAEWGPFTAQRPPVIDVGFLRLLRRGEVEVLPAVAGLTATGVRFQDGSEREFDAVVAATGFRTALSEVLELPGTLDERDMPRSAPGRATSFPGLYFIGFEESISGHLYTANRESKRLAAEIERYVRAKLA